jgi:CRISPR-associated exonuclease Cas4
MLPLIALVLFIAGLILLWQSGRRKKALGLPSGRITYADTSRWGPVEEPLFHRSLGLTGRPDYLVRQGEQYIPVEVKSSRISGSPYDSHIYQLAAYCLLVENAFGTRPAYGILHYPNRTFAIDFTPQLEDALLDLLEEMRSQDREAEIHRSHESAARCLRCGYRSTCEEALHHYHQNIFKL